MLESPVVPIHLLLTTWFILYGLYIGRVARRDLRDPTWRRHEIIACVILGMIQVLGSVGLAIYRFVRSDPLHPSAGGLSDDSTMFMFLHFLIGDVILFVTPWAFILQDRWNRSICRVITLLAIGAGFFIMRPRPSSAYSYLFETPMSVAIEFINIVIGVVLCVMGCLRLLSDYVAHCRYLYGVTVSCVGILMLMTTPWLLSPLVDGITMAMLKDTDFALTFLTRLVAKIVLMTTVVYLGILGGVNRFAKN